MHNNELSKLLFFGTGSNTDVIATSAMDESVHRVGRPYGDCAIVWIGKITKIQSSNNRISGVLYTCDGSNVLMINCYMPCDKYTEDENYTATLNIISQ